MVRREIGAGRHQKLCAAICVAVATTRWRRQVKSAAPKLDVTPPRRTGTSENVSRPPSSDCVVTSTQWQKQALCNVPPCGLVHCVDVSKKLAASIIRVSGSLKRRCHKLAQTSCPRRPSCQHLHVSTFTVTYCCEQPAEHSGQQGCSRGRGAVRPALAAEWAAKYEF